MQNACILFFRRHSVACAAFAALAMFAAAPYLVPIDPDSPVMRLGTLNTILILACAFPVNSAIRRHSLRSLLFGAAFALVFLLCLGLGSELSFYGEFLAGRGSLIRRVGVPILGAPMLGALASFLFEASPIHGETETRHVHGWAFFLFIAASYLLVFLALYPGVVSHDFEHEIRQFTTGTYEAAHPVFHTLFLGNLYRLGESIFGSMTAGAAMYSVVQLLLLAGMYAWACAFVQRRVHSRIVAPTLCACFALLPVHGVMAVSTAKDPLFAGLCVMLCLTLWQAAEEPEAFWHGRGTRARFAAVCLLMCLLRHNALFAVVPACIALVRIGANRYRRPLLLCALSVALCLLLPKGLEKAVNAEKTPGSELLSVPCQQLMRTAARAELPQAEYEALSAWFSNAVHRYREHCADPAKGGNFDFARYQAHPEDFWRSWLQYAKRYPRIYLEAFLQNCAGMWNPDDVSHAKALTSEEYDYIYLNTVYPYEEGRYDIHQETKLPGLRKLIYDFSHHAVQQKYPVLAQLFCPATYTFMMLLSTLLLFCRRQKRRALCLLPLWGLFLSVLFSAGAFVRYAYPMMAAAPVLLLLIYFAPAWGE